MNSTQSPRASIVLVQLIALALLAAGSAAAATINLAPTSDEFSATVNATCSLREAIQSTNINADFGGCTHSGSYGTDTINLAVGTYTLTRTGPAGDPIGIDLDNNVGADLDIAGNVTLDGAGGAGDVVIKGGASYSGRIVHVVSGTVALKDMTLRDGNLPGPGSRFGGGLRSNPGTTTTLTNVVVGANSIANGGGGGILNAGEMRLNGSSVTNNQTLSGVLGGGGVFNAVDSLMVLTDSRVLTNTATVSSALADSIQGGGGFFNDVGAELDLINTTVDGNIVDEPGGADVVRTKGGGILSRGSLGLAQSTVSNNLNRGNDAKGGGISSSGSAEIDRSLITANMAVRAGDLYDDAPQGGGIQSTGSLTITDSIISNNTSEGGGFGGGGVFIETVLSQTRIDGTTISGNSAEGSNVTSPRYGAGGGVMVFGGAAELVNSTLSGNQAAGSGGGLYSDDEASLLNVTAVANVSDADNVFGGVGGGVAANPSADPAQSGFVGLRNSVLAGNFKDGASSDCDNAASLGYNLVQNTSGCGIGVQQPDLRDVPALLGGFAANGGPSVGASTSPIVVGMGTHAPAAGSPLIDGGRPSGCLDRADENLALVLTVDQRGQPRPVDGPDPDLAARCDIGAVEVQGLSDPIFANSFE